VEETNPETNPPDAVLTVSAMATTTYYAWSYYPYYWGWYGGWYWYKSSDYYYPWYPYYPYGGTYVSSYTQGSLIMSLSDVSSATEETDSIPVVWLGVINGLMGSTDKADIQNRLEYGIDQAFDQSLYLKQN
jgi:hypothetical protein